jgi:hypothetical protein
MTLVRVWCKADHPRAAAVVHHMCSMILTTPQASSQYKNVYPLAHAVLWPTVADALHDADDLDPEQLSAYPKHLFSKEFSSSSWQSLPPCTDSENILANLDATCGILSAISSDCLSKLEIMSFESAEGVIRQMADIKAGGCISHFLLWCRLSAAIATGDVKLLLLEAIESQNRAAVLVAPSLKHVEACIDLAVERARRSVAAGDAEPAVCLLLDFIAVDTRLEVWLLLLMFLFVIAQCWLPQGNVRDFVDGILTANCKSICSSIEEVSPSSSSFFFYSVFCRSAPCDCSTSTCMPWAANPAPELLLKPRRTL